MLRFLLGLLWIIGHSNVYIANKEPIYKNSGINLLSNQWKLQRFPITLQRRQSATRGSDGVEDAMNSFELFSETVMLTFFMCLWKGIPWMLLKVKIYYYLRLGKSLWVVKKPEFDEGMRLGCRLMPEGGIRVGLSKSN